MSWRGVQHVYFAEACGKIKIGCSHNVEARLRTVGEWIPFPITLLAATRGALDLEAALHKMFDEDWSHGEWFNSSPRLLALIEDVKAGRPIAIDTTAQSTRRRGFIADKKRLSHRLTRLRKVNGQLPAALIEQLDTVPVGMAIPPKLLADANAFIDAHLTSRERKPDLAA